LETVVGDESFHGLLLLNESGGDQGLNPCSHRAMKHSVFHIQATDVSF